MQTTITDVLVTHVKALAQPLTPVLPWVTQRTDDERVALLARTDQEDHDAPTPRL